MRLPPQIFSTDLQVDLQQKPIKLIVANGRIPKRDGGKSQISRMCKDSRFSEIYSDSIRESKGRKAVVNMYAREGTMHEPAIGKNDAAGWRRSVDKARSSQPALMYKFTNNAHIPLKSHVRKGYSLCMCIWSCDKNIANYDEQDLSR